MESLLDALKVGLPRGDNAVVGIYKGAVSDYEVMVVAVPYGKVKLLYDCYDGYTTGEVEKHGYPFINPLWSGEDNGTLQYCGIYVPNENTVYAHSNLFSKLVTDTEVKLIKRDSFDVMAFDTAFGLFRERCEKMLVDKIKEDPPEPYILTDEEKSKARMAKRLVKIGSCFGFNVGDVSLFEHEIFATLRRYARLGIYDHLFYLPMSEFLDYLAGLITLDDILWKNLDKHKTVYARREALLNEVNRLPDNQLLSESERRLASAMMALESEKSKDLIVATFEGGGTLALNATQLGLFMCEGEIEKTFGNRIVTYYFENVVSVAYCDNGSQTTFWKAKL